MPYSKIVWHRDYENFIMAKLKTKYFCQACGFESPKWAGKCNNCNEWNTFVEELVGKSSKKEEQQSSIGLTAVNGPISIASIAPDELERTITTDEELNRVLGGGIVPGSIVLIGGEPGIGKSTLLLQVALSLTGKTIIYVSGEESEQQIKLRANRIGLNNPDLYLLSETSTGKIFKHLRKYQPDVVIIDSIQTLQSPFVESTPGSVSQIRECAGELQRYAKETATPVFLIGHITKEGSIAGPKVLEHIVDTVLQFEGDHHHIYRILRNSKNRFGSTAEIGIYEMRQDGLRQVTNPSELLITQHNQNLSGITVAATMEGARPLLIETQALVSPAVYGNPQRSTTGFDLRRLNMLLAVLEKRCGFRFGDKDVFVNIAGGIRVEDPAIDLAIICALLSSYEDTPVGSGVCFAGEVGLSGEIRTITRANQRISEAAKLGFEQIFLSGNIKLEKTNYDVELKKVMTVAELFKALF